MNDFKAGERRLLFPGILLWVAMCGNQEFVWLREVPLRTVTIYTGILSCNVVQHTITYGIHMFSIDKRVLCFVMFVFDVRVDTAAATHQELHFMSERSQEGQPGFERGQDLRRRVPSLGEPELRGSSIPAEHSICGRCDSCW